MEKKKNQRGLIVFIIVAVVVLLVTIFKFLMPVGDAAPREKSTIKYNYRNPFSILTGRQSDSTTITHLPGQKYIARLYIEGTIQEANSTYNQDWLLETIEELADDPFNKGIILNVNSPGGTVYEADELYLALLKYRGKNKPVYAYFESMAASGGYYIACAATKIVANRNTLTGSIGVIAGQSLDLTGLMENYGVKSETIHAGKNKNMGNYNEPMTDEQRQILQSIADECYEQFTEIVANARKMSIDKVQELADGRVYTAKQALSAGLVDSIGSFDDAEKLMEEKEFEGEDYMVEDYKYERYPNFYDYLYGLSSKIVPGKAESITGLPEAVEKVIDPEVKYPAFIYEQ